MGLSKIVKPISIQSGSRDTARGQNATPAWPKHSEGRASSPHVQHFTPLQIPLQECLEQQASLTHVLREEHNKERGDQVIDALHIAAGWVANGPDKQDSLKNLGKNQGKQVPALAMHKGKAEKHNC